MVYLVTVFFFFLQNLFSAVYRLIRMSTTFVVYAWNEDQVNIAGLLSRVRYVSISKILVVNKNNTLVYLYSNGRLKKDTVCIRLHDDVSLDIASVFGIYRVHVFRRLFYTTGLCTYSIRILVSLAVAIMIIRKGWKYEQNKKKKNENE